MTIRSQYHSINSSQDKTTVDAIGGFSTDARNLFFGWVLSISNEKSVAHEAGIILSDPTKLLAHIPADIKEDFCSLLRQATKSIGLPKTRSRKKLAH